MTTRALCFALALPLALVVGCDEGKSPAPTAGGTAAPTATTRATAAAPKPAEAPAAAAFPATALPSKGLTDFTIGVPTTAKVEGTADGDRTTIDVGDYRLIVKATDKPAEVAEMKGMLKGATFPIETADGLVAEMEEKGKKQFVLTRVVSVGDKKISCESAMTKPPTTVEKAREAFEICGSIKKK